MLFLVDILSAEMPRLSKSQIRLIPFWGLRHLYESSLPGYTIVILLVLAFSLGQGGLQFIFSEIKPGSVFDRFLQTDTFGVVGLAASVGAITSLFLSSFILVFRFVRDILHPKFLALDPSIDAAIDSLALSWSSALPWIFGMTILFVVVNYALASSVLGLETLDLGVVLNSGNAAILRVFVLDPINAACGGLAIASTYRLQQYLVLVARTISVDILKVEAYHPITLPPAMVFAFTSSFVAIVGAVLFALDYGISEVYLKGAMIGLFAIGAIFALMLFHPVLILRNRIAKMIGVERELLVKAIRGDSAVLENSNIVDRRANSTELASWLALLNTLSEWPVSEAIKRLLLFGVLPPLAWTLAAVIENTLY